MDTYQHLFTDGLDKVLSVSIWLANYGRGNTFAYYEKGKLKGYVAKEDLALLAEEGRDYLERPQNIQELLENSKEITSQVTQQAENLQKIDNLSSEQLVDLFETYTSLLQRGYSLYFATEEYSTTKLSLPKDEKIIKEIGDYRLSFIETCVKATEAVYELASHIGKLHGVSEKDVQFLTQEEIKNLHNSPVTTEELEERKQHFFIRVHPDHGLTYLYGREALVAYEALVSRQTLSGNTLQGTGASKGIAQGPVYILSLAAEHIADAIEDMPKGAILVTESTQPHLILACKKASAIVTDEGGILSHAAIVSRELGIPCVVGTHNATELLKNGQMVEVDGEKGIVTIVS